MKLNKLILSIVSVLINIISLNYTKAESQSFNQDWKFTLSDSLEYTFPGYNISSWQSVKIPHDWSTELQYDSTNGDGCTGYAQGGIAWYGKSFKSPVELGDKCYIIFDGVYNNSEYWLNGKKIGDHPYGYAPIYFDISEYLMPQGVDNQLMVRVDRSHYADSRWYTGSGIYRDVDIVTLDKLHIDVWGVFVTTPIVSRERARVKIDIDLKNEYTNSKNGVLVTDIYNMANKKVATISTQYNLSGNTNSTITQEVDIINPDLWGVDSPSLYYAKSSVICDDNIVESRTTRFGVRSIRFDAATGFYLNDENMKIKGVCLHHDAGAVGAAVPKGVWRRRLQTLKDGGCNAIRVSHNPSSREFLELCDEMGFLVQQEFFDEWDFPKDKRLNMGEQSVDYATRGYDRHFQAWGERDLKAVMLRDRNHPSVFQWSIGNEIEWTYKGNKEATGFFGADANGNYFWNIPPYSPERIREEWNKQPKQTYDIGRTAQKLAGWAREMDTTRPIIANCILPSISYETGYIDALDVVGFSYRRVMYDYGREHYPNKPIMGTENLGQWHEWKAVLERPYISGMFIWTGTDYLGEMGGVRSKWFVKATESGLLDLAGFEKPSYDMMKSLWSEEPFIALYSLPAGRSSYVVDNDGCFRDRDKNRPWDNRLWNWEDMNSHWNYEDGDKVVVEIYSNCSEIELFQNGVSLGRKYLKDFEDRIYKWDVTYSDGAIIAKGRKDKDRIERTLTTAGEVASIRLSVDKNVISSGGDDVIHIVAQLVDDKGREVKTTEEMIHFDIEGDCRLIGIDNGAADNMMPPKGESIVTKRGRSLLILQSGDNSGAIKVSASNNTLKSNEVRVKIK